MTTARQAGLAIAAVLATFLYVEIQRARHVRAAIESVEAAGGSVGYLYRITEARPNAPKWLRDWLGREYCIDIVSVSFFRGAGVCDADVRPLLKIPTLMNVNLSGTAVTPACWVEFVNTFPKARVTYQLEERRHLLADTQESGWKRIAIQ